MSDKPKTLYWADGLIIGWMALIGLAEGANLCALFSGWNFEAFENLFLGLLGIVVAIVGVSALLKWQRDKRDPYKQKERERCRVRNKLMGRGMTLREQIIVFLFAVLILIQIILLIMERRNYMVGDPTVETVNTLLATDTLYQINPCTGRAYSDGVPMRLQILCLPSLYACLCDVLKISAPTLVWTIVPICTLLLGYVAFDLVGRLLFVGEKRKVFLLLVAVVLLLGNYTYGMDGFGIQFAGSRGVTMRAVILLPYCLSALLRQKWWLVGLCVVVEACLVWTFYGMGVCLLLSVGMLLLELYRRYRLQKQMNLRASEGGAEND